ncbi:SpvB/TcaC N-terminal domain-containing protein [Chryseobacterium sp. MYb264]|uniref:SpvB/TcaC N-terminal domain-containing protein n=1 Tax=Chryseobacterium sp. MYb264 TaxID=2745153 RepID=UPI002E11DCCB|nr:SpvB/TcaC N-terminal domain-containing protein [Chryseobacterium sp. MYb264]
MTPGFTAKSNVSNPFVAKIGPGTENPGGGPTDSNAGANNPTGTTAPSGKSFHDTKGNIEVNGAGQLQFTLPIALPPGIKDIAPQIDLVYTSGSSNGIAGYGWNISGITSISRIGKNIEKDGEIKGVQLDYSDYYSFNGQRLILKSGEYGQDGAEYITEKYSNIKIKSIGSLQGFSVQNINGPKFWKVTFEDGSQAWYGATDSNVEFSPGRTPLEYNIIKWRNAQGNDITYVYSQSNNVSTISSILWGSNDAIQQLPFNRIDFNYAERNLAEQSYVNGTKFIQNKILSEIKISSNENPVRRYGLDYIQEANGNKYQFVKQITEYNSANEAANPITFDYETSTRSQDFSESKSSSLESGLLGDFDGDGAIDALEYRDQQFRICESFTPGFNGGTCINPTYKPAGLYIIKKALDTTSDELTFVGTLDTTKEEFKKALPISFKSTSGVVENKQGFAYYKQITNTTSGKKDIQLFVYSIGDNNQLEYQYTKVIPNSIYDNTTPDLDPLEGGYSVKTTPLKLTEMDLDGDGLSELLLGLNDDEHIKILKPQDPHGPIGIPEFDETFSNKKRYLVINMDNTVSEAQSYSQMSFYPYNTDIFETYKIGDFDGDGKTDLLRFDSGNRPFIIQFYKDSNNLFSNIERGFYLNDNSIKGISKGAVVGDFNGDGRSDLLVPSAGTTSDWYLYQSTGKSFIEEFKANFALYRQEPYFNSNSDGTATLERTSHQTYDLNKDGKSDFVTFNFRKERVKMNNSPTIRNIYYYNTIDIKISSGENKFNNDIRYSFNEGPLNDSNGFINEPTSNFNQRMRFDFQELLGSFRINKSLHQLILVAPFADRSSPGDRVKKISFYDISKEARINAINQGGLKTEIEYKELDPLINPTFYLPTKKEHYPYIEFNRVGQTFAVSQLKSSGLKQDFRYRGLIAHLKGKGGLGFRQIARSSLYAEGFENTQIWSGTEVDPSQENMPIKEWSIRTHDESKVFPTDISENNSELLSFKSTIYQIDKIVNGQVTTDIINSDKSKIITATIPKSTKIKDFLTNVITNENITYGQYYFPAQSIINTNSGYGIQTRTFEYSHNPSGIGSNYFIGRLQSTTNITQAYGDTKSTKEEYNYENNLLKTLKTWNRDNTGFLMETYNYDIFGNITQKVISNSIDGQTQTTKAEYETQGRFAIKQIDNLNLITQIEYNALGQIIKQTDPIANTVNNTYDGWGKLFSSKTNIGGTTTYQYHRDDNANITVTQYNPDGNISKKYINKLGQNYKISTKNFGQGQFVSKETTYDVLGRKLKESEPYFEGQSASQWNTFTYNDTVFPTQVTSTIFTGKQIKTSTTGLTTSVQELNGYARTTSQTTDALGNTIASTDKGGTIQFKYNATGEQIQAKYEENIVTTKYDSWGRKSEFNDPSNGLYKYEYDSFGQPKKIISPKGTKEYTYNTLGQLISQKEFSTTDGGKFYKQNPIL